MIAMKASTHTFKVLTVSILVLLCITFVNVLLNIKRPVDSSMYQPSMIQYILKSVHERAIINEE